jgi:hypothetical protein
MITVGESIQFYAQVPDKSRDLKWKGKVRVASVGARLAKSVAKCRARSQLYGDVEGNAQ